MQIAACSWQLCRITRFTATMAGQVAQRLGISTLVEVSSNGQLVLQDDEQIYSTYPQVRFVFGQEADQGIGTLFISTRYVCRAPGLEGSEANEFLSRRRIAWKCIDTTTSYAIKYHQVAMHAVSRDVQDFPLPCIYLQLDEGSEVMAVGGDDEEEDDEPIPEVRLVPSDASQRTYQPLELSYTRH
jgi:chloride channel, nucleotide-sensitive, 1A